MTLAISVGGVLIVVGLCAIADLLYHGLHIDAIITACLLAVMTIALGFAIATP